VLKRSLDFDDVLSNTEEAIDSVMRGLAYALLEGIEETSEPAVKTMAKFLDKRMYVRGDMGAMSAAANWWHMYISTGDNLGTILFIPRVCKPHGQRKRHP